MKLRYIPLFMLLVFGLMQLLAWADDNTFTLTNK